MKYRFQLDIISLFVQTGGSDSLSVAMDNGHYSWIYYRQMSQPIYWRWKNSSFQTFCCQRNKHYNNTSLTRRIFKLRISLHTEQNTWNTWQVDKWTTRFNLTRCQQYTTARVRRSDAKHELSVHRPSKLYSYSNKWDKHS